MAAIALKELEFFRNGSVFSENGGLNVVTSRLGVSPAWLLETVCSRSVDLQLPTLFVTFQSFEIIHSKVFKKLGLLSNPLFNVLDLSAEIHGGSLASMASKITSYRASVVVMETVDICIATGLASAHELAQFLYSIRGDSSSSLFVSCYSDNALINSAGSQAEAQTALLTELFMQASLIITMRPMPTGRADDVTGILRLSNGGRGDEVREAEYLYLVKGDSAKVFHR